MADTGRLIRRTATGVLVVGAVAVAVVSLRGSDSGSAAAAPAPAAATSGDHPGWWGGPWGGGGWGWGGPGGYRNALHGEVVVSKDGGGTETIMFQRGEVTDVNAGAVTVKSED